MSVTDQFANELANIETYIESQFSSFTDGDYNAESEAKDGVTRLKSSIHYGVFSGGKRFRPLVAALTAKALGHDPAKVLPFATAVEMIHSYSLIHDDLPLMDDDDERRGRPTNHKVYGEAMALLAGDALLTEAFGLLAKAYGETSPKAAIEAVSILSHSAGANGMVGGQSLDIIAEAGGLDAEAVKKLHAMKTGELIAVSAEGAAVVCEASPAERSTMREYGESLGLAFQLADDILDYDEKDPEPSGFPAQLGLEATRALLEEVSEHALKCIESYEQRARGLRALVEFNLDREL